MVGKNASKKSVKNSELWIEFDQMTSYHEVSWYWVKGTAITEKTI